ncbi:MAG: tetratricopeptide repeat protein [Spirochaetota bacterium]
MINLLAEFFSGIYQSIGIQGVIFFAFFILLFFWLFIYIKRKFSPFQRAKNYYDKGQQEEALKYIFRELSGNPLHKKALYMKAEIELQRQQYAWAEKDLQLLLDLKKPGDEIDQREIKKKLLSALFSQNKLLQTLNLAKSILKLEPVNPEALYYLSVIYLGQMYYKEASRMLDTVVRNRPGMHQAHFAYAAALAQLRDYGKALRHINRALELDNDQSFLYRVCCAGIHFLMENYGIALDVLKSVSFSEKLLRNNKQNLFWLRLNAFSNYMLEQYDEACTFFQRACHVAEESNISKDSMNTQKKPQAIIYNEYGARQNKPFDSKNNDNKSSIYNSPLYDYLKLREVALQEGVSPGTKNSAKMNSSSFLDIEGLSPKTFAALDYAFCLIKAGYLKQACSFLHKVRKAHPEVVGLKRLIGFIDEKINDREKAAQGNGNAFLEESTQSVISRKQRRYELWEYVHQWEKKSIGPADILIGCGFRCKKFLSPHILFVNAIT